MFMSYMTNINFPDSELKDEQSYDLEETYKPYKIITSCFPPSLKTQYAFRITQQSKAEMVTDSLSPWGEKTSLR